MYHEVVNLRKAIRHQLSNAWRLFKDGKLNAYKLPTGTVIVREEESQGSEQSVAINCRVSSSENKGNLEDSFHCISTRFGRPCKWLRIVQAFEITVAGR
jgi:predicted site-specific integrase-resolvase